MSKRVKIEGFYLVISSGGNVVGCGIDPPSACRDAVANSGIHTNWHDMALSGNYAITSATANATYDKEKLDESFAFWRDKAAGIKCEGV